MQVTIAGLAALAGGVVGTLVTSRQLNRRQTESQTANYTSDDSFSAALGQQPKQCNAIPTNGGGMRAQKRDPFDPRPREGYLSWDDYFMAVAFLSAQRSKDPNKQVGACIVSKEQVILGIGYNGFPRGCPDTQLPWAKLARSGNPLDTKYPYVCHAELNAILNKNTASLEGAKMFVTMFPCNECSKLLIQAGIKEVVYYEDKAVPVRDSSPNEANNVRHEDAYAASKRLLHMAGVQLRQHKLDRPLVFCVGT